MTDKTKLSDAQLLQDIRFMELELEAYLEIAKGFTKLALVIQGIGSSGYSLSRDFYVYKAKKCEEKLKLSNTMKQERGL